MEAKKIYCFFIMRSDPPREVIIWLKVIMLDSLLYILKNQDIEVYLLSFRWMINLKGKKHSFGTQRKSIQHAPTALKYY
jgi:hypothetical protein